MFQRPESTRQQLGGTHLNSAYFTSASGNGGASETYTQQQQSSPSYSYSASSPSPYYGGDSSNSYSYNDDTASKARNSMKSKTSSGGTSSMIMLLLIWTVVVAGTTFGFMYYSLLPTQIKAAEERLGEELEGQAVYKQKFHEMQEHSRKLEIQRDEETSLAQTLDAELAKERQWALEWKNKVIQLEQDVDALQKRIQQSAKKELIRKYGKGPYNVEFEISFNGLEDRSDMGWMTVELASADDMPHAVFNFMEQVDRGMYNYGEFAFTANGPHVTMAEPVTEGLRNVFGSSGIANVQFQEFSPKYNHDPYTIALAGRPSGPSFYFNIQDNGKNHGPGGYAQDGSADPCFGRITRGRDLLDRIHSSTGELRQGDWKAIQQSITIISAKKF